MQVSFAKDKIIESSLSPYDNYCLGYTGEGGYFVALVMAIGVFKRTLSHAGSVILDSIVAYDRAETAETYLGQINMQIVSSFCGPQGLIWGYDVAAENETEVTPLLGKEKIGRFSGVKIRNGTNLRRAAKELFGTKDDLHFPFLPGTHVPCAGRFLFEQGPINLYSAIAIGIPENRSRSACLLMEDVGRLDKINPEIKQEVIQRAIESVFEIGRNQEISYKEIFVDFVSREINSEEIGCALVAMPYFHLAKKAFTKYLSQHTLREWKEDRKHYFLHEVR